MTGRAEPGVLLPAMEQEQVIRTSPESNSMVSATVGRVMSILLGARPKKLEDAISRLDSAPKRSSPVSLEESLWILHNYIRDAAQREESLDEIIVPMTEHSLKHKGSKHGAQAMILLNWLFQDEFLFQAIAADLVSIMRRKDDHYIAIGWCILVRGLVEYEITMKQFINNGIKEKFCSLLKIFSSCITHLVSIVCNGSTLQGGFELPTRLSVAAADCILSLTTALTKKDLVSKGSDDGSKPSNSKFSSLQITLLPAEKKVKPTSSSPEVLNHMEMKFSLWDHLDDLIILVQKLLAWSRKSRSLHATGLERVLKWLRSTKGHYSHFQNDAGSQMLKTGVLLLSSCWKHYGMLMHLEDYNSSQHYKELMDQYLSGIQFYAGNCTDDRTENNESGIETIKFFLNCLALLLGHFDGKQFASAMSEDGLQISRVLISQLHSADEDVIDGVVSILKAVIFRARFSLAGSSETDTRDMDAVLPLLLHLLDERDGTARAVVMLLAEYCSLSTDNRCLQEVLKRLASADVSRRRNAIDVISELFRISPDPINIYCRQDIANHLLERLGDEESVIRAQASNLIPIMDPSLVLPAVIGLVYSSDEVVQSSASNTFVMVLKCHNHKFEVLCMLLNSLSDLCQNPDHPEASGDRGKGGSKLDADRVLKLVPQWSESVEDWNFLIEPLIDKLFAEPSNAILVKFLNYISEHLADSADVVLNRLLLHSRKQNEWKSPNYKCDNPVKLEHSLFDCLCPLLIIRLLPLRVFNNLNSSLMYGKLQYQGYIDIDDDDCIAGILLKRAFNKFEFDDVRKLAAELCGRIHPQVLFPIIASQLEHAANAYDVMKLKACLFSVCTSLVVRGRDSILHPSVLKIRNTIEIVLLWPSLDRDEADATVRNSIVCYVIDQLTRDKYRIVCSSTMANDGMHEASLSLSFRLCMANVLISACQKISDPGKKPFARKILPHLIQSIWVVTQSEIRAACVEVFFSAVYHLKSFILPYASDLLKISLKTLREGSEKEKLAGAKLMASLMASEEKVVESIAGGLLEARTLLSGISSSDPSHKVRQVCKQLLACLTSP